MNPILQQCLPDLTHEEKIELLDALKAAIAEEMCGEPKDAPCACPHCGSMSFTKKGYGPRRSQRWVCKDCKRTFSAKTKSLFAHSRLSATTWMEFAACTADGLSLRISAARCKVSLPTAWFMRMRICEVMSRRLAPLRAGGFQVDGTYFKTSFSGNHKRSAYFDMPRRAHRNGQDGRRAGGSKTKGYCCVVCGINELGDSFCEIMSLGVPGKAEVSVLLDDYIPQESTVTTDGHLSYGKLSGARKHRVVTCKEINMVNALHSRLESFMRSFHGVATRRIQRYLDWFCYREQFKNSDADRRELLFCHAVKGRYLYTRTLTFLEQRPFLSYWDKRRYAGCTSHLSMVV